MNLSQIDFNQLTNPNLLLRVFELLFLVLFVIYSLITIREVALMNRTIRTSLASFVSLTALIQLGLGLLVLVLILVR